MRHFGRKLLRLTRRDGVSTSSPSEALMLRVGVEDRYGDSSLQVPVAKRAFTPQGDSTIFGPLWATPFTSLRRFEQLGDGAVGI
jgi:hypothetical protein